MISGGQISNRDSADKDEPKKSNDKTDAESFSKLTPEQAKKTRAAAALVIQELMKTEQKKRTPRLLWYLSGCVLVVIIGIIASFLIPLLSMVSDAKEVVTQHLTYLQKGEDDKAFKLCDAESFGSRYILKKIEDADDSIKTNGFSKEFKEFAKELMRKKYNEKDATKLLKALANKDLHQAVEMCDVDYFARIAHDKIAEEFKTRLDKGPFDVQKFSTVEKPPAVRGQFTNNSEYFTYNVFNDGTWKIYDFRFGVPVKSDDERESDD